MDCRVDTFAYVLKCGICKQLAIEAHSINGCLHTYCKTCIDKYFEECNREHMIPVCHTCIPRSRLGSGAPDNIYDKVVRPDLLKQALIQHIVQESKVLVPWWLSSLFLVHSSFALSLTFSDTTCAHLLVDIDTEPSSFIRDRVVSHHSLWLAHAKTRIF